MQTPADNPAQEGSRAGTQPATEPPAPLGLFEGERPAEREQLLMLMIGFGTGLAIGGVFLIYIVLEIAHLL